jgi:hypothetical protein
MKKDNSKKARKKKGLSVVMASLIMIALTIAAGAVIWTVISNVTNKELTQTQSCFGVLDQVKINDDYTCYDSLNSRVQFSINVGDIDLTGILVAVSYSGTSKEVTLTGDPETVSDVKNYPYGSDGVKMPDKNSQLTYFYNGISTAPTYLKIAPIVGKQQCDTSDTLYQLDDCSSLIS